MALSLATRRLVDRVERSCTAAADARTLRLQVLAELRTAVPFDAYAWVLTDPETEVGAAPIADVPCLPELPRLIRLRYLAAVHRWTDPVADPVRSLLEATGGDLAESLLWRELLSRYAVRDVATVVLRDRFGCWAFLDLWRSAGDAFGRDDAAALRAIAGPVTEALRRVQAASFTSSPTPQLDGPLVLLLSPDLEVLRRTPGTEAALRALVPRDDDGPPVPATAYNVAAQLLAVEAGVDAHPPQARVHVAGSGWVTVRAARLQGAGADADIAVTIEPCTPADRLSLFARVCGLSARERELLELLGLGGATREIASRMFLSEHTVQDHLKSVFAKTGTSSRRSLLARARGG